MNAAQAEPLFAEFPPVSTAEWQAAILKDLKGKDPKSLLWKTEDGFTVKPFYRLEDAPGLPSIGAFPQRWKICVAVDDAGEALEAIGRGAEAIELHTDNEDTLEAMLEHLPLDKVEVHIRTGGKAASLLRVIRHFAGRLKGSFNCGPVREAVSIAPDFLPFVINAGRFCEVEATATQELALAMAQGSEYLDDLGPVSGEMAFLFTLGSNYFFEIAKLRAARLLWPRIVKAYEPSTRPEVHIYAQTSEWNKTVYDPYVNMLRSTTESMAAVIGGAELLTVTPFNSAFARPDEFARRMAVNTQLILREEAHFDELSDPASGSWYIESLTDTMAREAWNLFQQIEAAGGYDKAIGSGLVDTFVGPAREARKAAIAQRRRQFTGVNVHANPKERVMDAITAPSAHSRGPKDFEAVRLRTEKYEKKRARAAGVPAALRRCEDAPRPGRVRHRFLPVRRVRHCRPAGVRNGGGGGRGHRVRKAGLCGSVQQRRRVHGPGRGSVRAGEGSGDCGRVSEGRARRIAAGGRRRVRAYSQQCDRDVVGAAGQVGDVGVEQAFRLQKTIMRPDFSKIDYRGQKSGGAGVRPAPRAPELRGRHRAIPARPLHDHVRHAAVDGPAVRGFFHGGGNQRLLPPQHRRRSEGAVRCVRSADTSRLRLRPPARLWRRRQGGGGD